MLSLNHPSQIVLQKGHQGQSGTFLKNWHFLRKNDVLLQLSQGSAQGKLRCIPKGIAKLPETPEVWKNFKQWREH